MKMVEKTKPAADTEKLDGLTKRPGILKIKSNPALETVPEFAQSPLERTESNLDAVESEKSATPNEEQTKFKTLCEGVQNCLALFQTSLTELLCLKDELLKHTLPPSLLLKTVLVTGKLFRSSSDLSVPIMELVRMVKLYSMPWETKGAALKKLHEDYENKQRQLNVALQKLVLVGIQSERLAQERKVLNWEKLFSKMMTSKAHGYRWKFLIESFKEKVNTGEVHVAESSTDEEAERERRKSERQLDFIQRRSMNRDTAAKRIMRESVSGATSPLITVEKEKQDGHEEDELVTDEKSTSVVKRSVSPETRTTLRTERTSILRPNPPGEEKPQPKKMTRPRIKFFGASDSEDAEDETESTTVKFTEKPPKPKRKAMFPDNVEEKQPKVSGVKFVMSDEEENPELGEKDQVKVAASTTPPVVKFDKACWTHEPEFDRFLHLRIFRPECKKVNSPLCSVAFNGQLLKTDVFEDVQKEPGEESTDELVAQGLSAKSGSKETEQIGSGNRKTGSLPKTSQTGLVGKRNGKTNVSRGASSWASNASPSSRPASGDVEKERSPRSSFKELVFKLPDNNGRVSGDVTKETIRIAVHPGRDHPMMAMSSISYGDLKIMDHFEGRWSHTVDVNTAQQQFPLTSVVTDRDMPFNSLCGHVSVVCYLSQVERPRTFAKSTETVSFDELIDAAIETRRRAEQEDSQEKIPEPLYTEGDMKALRDQHAEELQLLQEEYEKRLNELAQGLGPYPPGVEFPQEYTDVATSPIFIQSPLPLRSQSPDQSKSPRPPPGTRSNSPRKPRPKIPSLPDWGKDLPQDFLVRLHLFAENSTKYRQELREKTRRAIQEKYELQMAVQNRLAEPEEERTEETDVCLPAVFMPTRSGHVFSPKAHSYFQPPGATEGRLTQAPSIFKLPAVTTESQISVLNLFEMGQKYNPTGPPWVHQERTRPQTIANLELSQFAPPPPTACDVWSPPPYQERARTR